MHLRQRASTASRSCTTSTTTGNQVVGNYIGTDLTGNAAAAYTRNSDHGVHVDDGAQNTVVTDNVVGNAGSGAASSSRAS